jgi:hypothetical protein
MARYSQEYYIEGNFQHQNHVFDLTISGSQGGGNQSRRAYHRGRGCSLLQSTIQRGKSPEAQSKHSNMHYTFINWFTSGRWHHHGLRCWRGNHRSYLLHHPEAEPFTSSRGRSSHE